MSEKLQTSSSRALSWDAFFRVGSIDAFISTAHAVPLLTEEEERSYAVRLRDFGDEQAAQRLVLSHLRLVVSTARSFVGYHLPQEDLIQAGVVGLLKAVRGFDPDRGLRLTTYALSWIKSEMHDFALKNWRIVKVATTKAQRKLFFNLRSMKSEMRDGESLVNARGGLTQAGAKYIASQLNVTADEVLEMEVRLSAETQQLFQPSASDEEGFVVLEDRRMSRESDEPDVQLEHAHRAWLQTVGVAQALDLLDPRSRHIVQSRWLDVDDSGAGLTLHDLAAIYGVSAERIRQIEANALKKMRATLSELA